MRAEKTMRCIGILAGNGSLPEEIARAVVRRGDAVTIVGIDGEVAPVVAGVPVTRVGWGEIGRILATFRNAGCQHLVIVGGVTRPDLTSLRPDLGAVTNIPALLRVLMSGGDDGVLRGIVRFFEAKGFTVVSPADIAPGLVIGAGPLGQREPSSDDAANMLLGSSIVRALGAHDIGQGVVVHQGRIEAIEAAEGTDRMIQRVAERRRAEVAAGRPAITGGVLVKRPKPGQELRVDLPTIGPATIARAADAGLAGIAVLAGQTLAAERIALINEADQRGLFVYGFVEHDQPAKRTSGLSPLQTLHAWSALGSRKPDKRSSLDAHAGVAALSSLAELSRDGSAVVNRGYVLGLEPGGRVLELLARVVRLKQWGEGRWRRAGMAILGEDLLPDLAMIEAAAHLKGLALMASQTDRIPADVIAAADRAGLMLLARSSADRTGKSSP